MKSSAANNSLSKKNKSRKLQKNHLKTKSTHLNLKQTSLSFSQLSGLRPFFPRCSLALTPLPHSNEQGWAEKFFGIEAAETLEIHRHSGPRLPVESQIFRLCRPLTKQKQINVWSYPKKKNYFTSSDPHHDMLGGGCQVRAVI